MYNGIGLQTARGSGTNGYVQTNKFFIRPKTSKLAVDGGQGAAGIAKKPNKEILEHDRKRQIELKLVILEETLADQGYTETEIQEKLAETRRVLEAADAAAERETGGVVLVNNKSSETQTHQIAARKEKQMEKLGAALGIDYRADDDAEFEEGEIQRGRGGKGSKTGRQLKEDVNMEDVDRGRSVKVVDSNAADGNKLILKEPKRTKAKKRIVDDDSSDSNSRSGDDTDSSVSGRRDSPVKKTTKKGSGAVSKKRHDTDSDNDSIDGRQKYSSAKPQKLSGTTAKKRHDSETETDVDSDDDSGKSTPVTTAKKTRSSGRDDKLKKQEIKRKQHDTKRRKQHESSDSESERSLGRDSDDDSEKLHRQRGKERRRSSQVESKAGIKLEGRKGRHDSESSDSDRKSHHTEDSRSDSDMRTVRRATLKKPREGKHKNNDDSDFNRYDPKKFEGRDDDKYLTAYENGLSAGMFENNDRFEKQSQHAVRGEGDPHGKKDRDRERSASHRTGTSSEDHKIRAGRGHKRSGEGSRDYGLEADHETIYNRSIQGRHDKPRESDKNVDGARLSKKDIVDSSAKGRNRGSSPPDSTKKHSSGRPKNSNSEDESGRYRSRPEIHDDGKSHHENKVSKERRDTGRDKNKDEEVRNERDRKEHADVKGRSKYSGDHRDEEDQSYSSLRRVDETHDDGSRKRGRKEDTEDKSRRDERDRGTSKRGRYDDSHSHDSRRYESDKHDSRRSRH